MKKYILLALVQIIFSCSEQERVGSVSERNNKGEWIIDSTKVLGKLSNNFPLVNNPGYTRLSEDKGLRDSDRVLLYRAVNQLFVFPIHRLGVEVVNDEFNNIPIVISYCPITESGMAWNRIIDNDTLSFRASGMLYNENLMPTDSANKSIWSQMRIGSVYGDYLHKIPKTYQLIESTAQTASQIDSDAMVMNDYNHKSTKSSKTEFLNLSPETNYFGLLEGSFSVKPELSVILYKLTNFKEVLSLEEYKNYLIIGDKEHGLVTAFIKESGKEFMVLGNQFPNIMQDNLGNIYDVFGRVTLGPDVGMRLNSPTSYLAQLWAWELFFENITFAN